MNILNSNKEISKLKEILEQLETTVNDAEFEKIQYHAAIRCALKKQSIKKNIQLLGNIVLAKLGRIPYCSVDKYRKDMEIRRSIQEIRNQLALLECSKMPIIDPHIETTAPEDKIELIQDNVDVEALKKGYIAFVVNSLDRGGLEQVVGLLAQGFFEKNIPIKILCLDNGGLMAEQLQEKGIEVLVFHGKGYLFKRYIKKNPPILVNTHYVKRHIKFLYKNKIPVIEVIHNMYVYYCEHVARIERKNEKYFTKLIAVSEIVKETYCNRIKQSDKITVIGNAAILRAEPKMNRAEVRKLLGIPQDAYVMLNVGSIDPRKNQVGIVTAFDIVSKLVEVPIYLVFAGNVQDEAYNAKLLKAISECDYKTQIICLSYYERIRELYLMADVFVLDSYYEGWSIAATEALYDGLPIIHSKCGSAVELINEGRFGYLISNPAGKMRTLKTAHLQVMIARAEYKNTTELVQTILKAVANREFWMKQRCIIAEEAKKKYSIRHMENRYVEEFNTVEG